MVRMRQFPKKENDSRDKKDKPQKVEKPEKPEHPLPPKKRKRITQEVTITRKINPGDPMYWNPHINSVRCFCGEPFKIQPVPPDIKLDLELESETETETESESELSEVSQIEIE